MFTLIHGSSVNLLEKGGFKHFDYEISNVTDESLDSRVNNGLDSSGPGMYNFNAENSKETLSYAKGYAGPNGFIHVSKLDLESSDLLNNRDSWEIEKEEWVEFIHVLSNNIRKTKGYDLQDYEEKCDKVLELSETEEGITNEQIIEIFDGYDIDFEADYNKLENFDDFWEWKDDIDQVFALSDPCCEIEEIGPVNIVNYAYDAHDDIWGVLNSIWVNTAIYNSSNTKMNYNETFYDSIMETIGVRHDLTAATNSDEDALFIVFNANSNKFKIEKALDANPKYENENSY